MELEITAEKPANIPQELKDKWLKSLYKVKMASDKVAIIFLGEMLEILSREKSRFSCTGTVDYGMFGGCDFSWTLSSGSFRIKRQMSREISESWQRVEVDSDNVQITGLEEYKFSWNGECGEILSPLEIEIELDDLNLVSKIEKLGNRLFKVFTII